LQFPYFGVCKKPQRTVERAEIMDLAQAADLASADLDEGTNLGDGFHAR
jgi:hypothetical protein